MTRNSRLIIYIAGAAALAALALLYAFIDPSQHFFPRCVILSLTGYQCPGCGSQRAVHALLTGDLATAWRMNAFLVASIPLIVLMLVSAARKHKNPRLYNALNSTLAIILWTVAIILWTVVRNL